jgi:putative transposase
MLITKGYKYRLRINNKEKTLLLQCAGTARFAWNWGLAERKKKYHTFTGTDRYTNALKQHKEINQLKKTAFRWMHRYSKCIPQEALRDLDRAFHNYFRGRKNGGKVGFPRFKKKWKTKASFRLTGTIKVWPTQRLVQLPRLRRLRVFEYPRLPPSSRILSATISREVASWFVILTVEENHPDPPPVPGPAIGLDAGLKNFVTLSNGLVVPPPRFLLKRLRKLRRLSKAHSRKKLGSTNRKKSAKRLARFHQRVSNCRQDFLHKLSTTLAKSHSVIVVEDLHVKGLSMNKKQSKYWADLAHGLFRSMLSYKARWYGSRFVKGPQFFPSSKLCSNCLIINHSLTLNDRTFTCWHCNSVLDRDVNAATNLLNYYCWNAFQHNPTLTNGLPVPESSPETLNACGEDVSPGLTRLTSRNQEQTALEEKPRF